VVSEDVRFVTKELNQLGHCVSPFTEDPPFGALRRIIEPLD
jgi:predicted RNA methylase